MDELEKRLEDLELRFLKEITDVAKDSQDIWKAIGYLGDSLHEVIKDIRKLRVDVDKLIENSCGCRKSA